MNKPIKLQTQGLTFESGAVLYASQLTNLRDKIDEVIDFLPASFAQTQPTTSGESQETPSTLKEEDVQRMVNDAKQELQNKINTINAWIAQQPDGNTHVRTDEEMVDLFKGPFKSLLFEYGITDSEGHPFFNLFFEEIGVTPTMISGWIDKSNQSNIGISADHVIIGGDTTLTGKLTAMDAELQNITVNNEASIKKVVSEMIETEQITVTGDLHYNRIIGNVEKITVDNSVISNTTSYVQCLTNLIRLPKGEDVVVGQTIYVEGSNCNILPSNGTALLPGLVYAGSHEVGVGNGSDTDTYYDYAWDLIEYGTTLKSYNTKQGRRFTEAYPNMSGATLHCYVYTGSGRWVETTPQNSRGMHLSFSYAEKVELGL